MKKTGLIAAGMLWAMISIAQNKLFIFAGPQATTAHYTAKGEKQETGYKIGVHAGMGMKVPFEGPIYFAPSVFYSLKGYDVTFSKPSFPPDSTAKNNSTRLHTFEIAPLIQVDLGKGATHAFLRFGPSFDIQLFGREKFDLNAGSSVSRNMIFSFGDYGHFSFNLLAQLGVETNGIMIYGTYSHGVASINNFDGGPLIKHRVFGLSIGKTLNKKKIIIDTRNKE